MGMYRLLSAISPKFLLLLLGLLCLLIVRASRTNSSSALGEKHLAIQLMPNWGDPITFSLITIDRGQVVAHRKLTRGNFLMIGTGRMRDRFNPDQRNLFEDAGIQPCDVNFDSINRVHHFACDPMDQLWKLRYGKHPTMQEESRGWAANDNAPDHGQMSMLGQFGIQRLDDLIYGENVFALLRAINDESWVQQYRSQ